MTIEQILDRPFTKFYSSDGLNINEEELQETKTRPISSVMKGNLLHETESARCK